MDKGRVDAILGYQVSLGKSSNKYSWGMENVKDVEQFVKYCGSWMILWSLEHFFYEFSKIFEIESCGTLVLWLMVKFLIECQEEYVCNLFDGIITMKLEKYSWLIWKNRAQ